MLGIFSLQCFWIHLSLGVLDAVFCGIQFWLDLLHLHHTFHFYKWSWKIFLCLWINFGSVSYRLNLSPRHMSDCPAIHPMQPVCNHRAFCFRVHWVILFWEWVFTSFWQSFVTDIYVDFFHCNYQTQLFLVIILYFIRFGQVGFYWCFYGCVFGLWFVFVHLKKEIV